MGVAAIVAVEPVVGAVAEPVVGLVVPDAVVVVEPVAGLVAVVAVAPDEAELVVVPEGAAEPVVLVQCDIRAGRSAEQRERLGAAIAAVLAEELDWPTSHTIVEFTQHAGDEFWRADGLSGDWAPGEAG